MPGATGAIVAIFETLQDPQWEHWLLVRRSRKDAEERAYYVVFAPASATLAELAGVAGLRWTIETCFATAKDELGLDHCEARSWPAWHRHITLVMAAAAFLARLRADLVRASMTGSPEGKRNKRIPGRADANSRTARRNRRHRSSDPPSARPRYLPEADDARIAVPMG